MNAVVASFFALLAVASSGVVVPSFYNAYSSPLAYNYNAYHVGAPLAYSAYSTYSAPLAYQTAAVAPIAYAATPAIQSGYVAANRGAVHIAPLPEGPLAASHHINTAPAPGTL